MSLASIEAKLKSFGIDRYLFSLVLTVGIATLLPASGIYAEILDHVIYWAISLLFFLYGAKLSTETIIAGMTNWRLQSLVLVCTYIAFPVFGILLSLILGNILPAALVTGFVFLTCLPSTVQSSIAFTSMARGNVPAAICAASVSNLLGVFITPLLVALLLHTSGAVEINMDSILAICLQILLPFILGQVARPFVGKWIQKHKTLTGYVDRGSILLIIYGAFSAGMVAGIWAEVGVATILVIILISSVLLAYSMGVSKSFGTLSKMPRADQLALFFCGSKKSMATGLPMAGILFAGQEISLIVIPLIIFHQLQLFLCAIIAQREASRFPEETTA